MAKIDEPGIYPDLPMADYVADPCPDPSLSKGVIIDLVERSPMHAYHNHPRLGGGGDRGSNRADIGSASHAMLLGGDEAILIVDAPDFRTKAAREARDEARGSGRIPILQKDRKALDDMVGPARERLAEFGAGTTEQTVIWAEDGDPPIWGKARPDWLADDRRVIVDYKTATNADPTKWIKSAMLPGGYDMQAAWYLRGLSNLLGPRDRDFLFLVQEIDPPFAVSVVGIGPELAELSNRKIEAGIRLWREALKSNHWRGYQSVTHWAEAPAYMIYDWENRAAAYGEGEL